MPRQFTVQARLGGNELDNTPDSVHIAPLSGFNLIVDSSYYVVLCRVTLGKLFEYSETIDDAARLKLDSTTVVPFL